MSATFWGNSALIIAYLAQVVFISRFGAGGPLDAYLATNAVTNFFLAGVGGGFLNSLVSSLLGDDQSDFKRLSSAIGLAIGAVFVFVGTTLALFAEAILDRIAPGLMTNGGGLAVYLLRVNALALVLNGAASGLVGVLYSRGRMGIASFSPAFVSIGGISGVLLLGNSFGVSAIAWGTVGGSLVRLAVGLISLGSANAIELPRGRAEWARASGVLGPALPLAFMGMLIFASSVLDKRFASWLPPGSITLLSYGIMLNTTVANLVVGGLSIAGTQSLSAVDPRQAQRLFRKILWSSFLIAAPLIALFITAREPIITLLLGWGKVTAGQVGLLGNVVLWGSGILIAAPTTAIASALYSKRKNKEIAISILIGIAVFWLLATFLTPWLGIVGLALAYSALYIVSAVFLFVYFFRLEFTATAGRASAFRIGRLSLALLLGGVGGRLALHVGRLLFPGGPIRLAAGVQVLLAGLAIFLVQAAFWRSEWFEILGSRGGDRL
ncbi:MAG: murein biosynthesis integral membrane protein MurJ [Candidatus Aquicultorales bacterium]